MNIPRSKGLVKIQILTVYVRCIYPNEMYNNFDGIPKIR
jgi:hypothetical protein